jgi:ADP-ribose pyrophosphatase YjhB (NUDIX family)
MNTSQELHKAQVSILRSLRHANSARYSELMRPTGLESDVFKFHLRKLLQQKIIEKKISGEYALTSAGKEFANNLSRVANSALKQPKLSVAVIASRQTPNEIQYLFQMRQRNPFYGFWGCISGPAQWGESFEKTAKYEFEKQTGLRANYKVLFFHRKTDVHETTGEILEDKLFTVVEASDIEGRIENKWSGGFNAWMSLSELKKHPKYFMSALELAANQGSTSNYTAEKSFYTSDEY